MKKALELLHNQSLLEFIPTAISVIDEHGLIRSFNKKACEFWGQVPKLMDHNQKYCGSYKLYRPDGTYLPHDSTPMVLAISKGIETNNVEIEILRPNGTRITVMSNISPLKDDEGMIIGAINSFQDITEFVNIRRELTHKKIELDMRDTFLSICSHELKNPLTVLIMEANIIQKKIALNDDSVFDHDKIKRMLQNSSKQLDRLNRLVDEMLDLHRIKSGNLTMRLENLDIVELIRNVILTNIGRDNELKDKITFYCEEVVFGEFDAFRIEQVINNLFTNSIKYGDNKPVEIIFNKLDKFVKITFKDQGIGIDKSDQERIFNRFERVKKNEKNIKGVGLGLYVTKQIIEAHQGTIQVSSQIGTGSTFEVILPLSQEK